MGGGWRTPRPGRFTSGKESRYPLYWRLNGPPSSIEIKNEWSCTSIPLIRLDGVDRDFTFYLLVIPNFTTSINIYLNNRTYWISYMVLNGTTIVNAAVGKICERAVMADSNFTSQALFWVTEKALLNLPACVLRT